MFYKTYATLALLDTDHHALAVDVGGLECNCLRDAQSRRVANGEDGASFASGHAAQKLPHFFGTQYDGEGLLCLGHRQYLNHIPGALQRDHVQEAKRSGGNRNRAWRKPLLVGQIELIVSDVGRAEAFRGSAEVSSEQRNLLQVGLLSILREIMDLVE